MSDVARPHSFWFAFGKEGILKLCILVFFTGFLEISRDKAQPLPQTSFPSSHLAKVLFQCNEPSQMLVRAWPGVDGPPQDTGRIG
jgi:hypothetical protein